MEQSWWNSVVGQENSHGGTVWWNRRTVIVEQCGGKVEQSWWNSVVEQWNSQGGTVMVEQCGGQWNSHGGTLWWNSGTLMVEQCNETVEQ